VELGNFREDLYYRLSVFPVQVPPLRRRGDDVVQLAQHFLEQVCRDFGRTIPALSQGQVEQMRRYSWPGNIRELKNVIERAVILAQGDSLRLDLSLPEDSAPQTVRVESKSIVTGAANFYTDEEMKAQQRENLCKALDYAEWRISGPKGAATLLGMKPSTLTDRMRSLGLSKGTAGL
jgi:transcriptional regulator with GAF, ATPase, and Fis domain